MTEAKRRTPPDWSRTGTIAGFAESLRKNSDAICVLVIRPHDSVMAVDPQCKPEDAAERVIAYAPRLAQQAEQARREKKQAARLSGGGVGGDAVEQRMEFEKQ
jgi:hypothetical protein